MSHIRLCCDVRALSAYGFSVKEFEVYGLRKLDDGTDSPDPVVTLFEAEPSNGALTARLSATHPSGSVFARISLENKSGDEAGSNSLVLASEATAECSFSPLVSGLYTLRVVASDAFGNLTTECIEDIEVTYSIAGINLALGKPAVASSHENEGLKASNAVDGLLDTRWGSLFNDDEWLTVDLGMPYDLTDLRIHWNQPAYATHYSVSLSLTGDDADFSTVASRSNFVHSGQPENIVLPDGLTARFVRITGHKRATQYGTSINELEVYGKDSTTGLGNVGVDSSLGESWFTLQGLRISRPDSPGIYIHLNNNSAKKVAIK